MMNFTIKYKTLNTKNRRLNFYKNENFMIVSKILVQSKYSTKLDYLLFKYRFYSEFFTKIKNHCIFSSKSRILTKSIKVNEQLFNKQVNTGNFAGFFAVVW